ncbi:MAG: hypothetical protein HY717_13025, partial [Planctomycetes bacterium]|nr:hypothetical protein [Planctomycetota bacterium]
MIRQLFSGWIGLGILFAGGFPGSALRAADFGRGDGDGSGAIESSDALRILHYLFRGQGPLECEDAADADDSGALDLTDPITILLHLYLGGPAPPAPFPACGSDPTPDPLDCRYFPACPQSCEAAAQPLLCALEGDGLLCPGGVVALKGVNFPRDLNLFEARFRGPSAALLGAPLSVEFPPDPDPRDGLDSRLEVLVPAGLESGLLELFAGGLFAGAAGYRACPMVYGFGIGADGKRDTLEDPARDFGEPEISVATVFLYGINFGQDMEILLEDGQGSRALITQGNFQVLPDRLESGLQSLRFNLVGVSLAIRSPRDNIRVTIRLHEFRSNTVVLPIQQPSDSAPDKPLGPVVNGVILPAGVRGGPIRLRYSFYDRPIEMSYQMLFEWTADGGKSWHPALSKEDDPESHGTRLVVPGQLLFDSPAGLLPSGGALKTFTWDALKDPRLFQTLVDTGRRQQPIHFRVQAKAEFAAPGRSIPDLGLLFETPPLAYFDLGERPGDPGEALRQAEYAEEFESTFGADAAATTALWGPPFNPGLLAGKLDPRPAPAFGAGTFDLVLGPSSPRPDNLIGEFYRIDTARLRITHEATLHFDRGDVQVSTPVFPIGARPNPGEGSGEFHLRALTIAAGMEVRAAGSRPLVVKLSGEGLGEGDLVFQHGGTLLASGQAGAPAEMGPGGGEPGAGGEGVLGAGEGGGGAAIILTGTGGPGSLLA